MKDKIFIAWSGDITVALRVKDILEHRCNYKCYIGGNSANDSAYASVGDTVIQQIKGCNQAIIIFQNRKDGLVSNNLFFELGYTLASYGPTKTHCVKRATDAISLPTDFDGAFVEPLEATDDEKFASSIVKYFLQRQKMSVNTNKMQLIDNRYIIRGMIKSHFSEEGSKCSDYELAQYILFYTQAAHMFGDMNTVQKELQAFKQENQHQFSRELSMAVDMSLVFAEFSLNTIISDDGNIYMDKAYYRTCKLKYESFYSDICRVIENKDETNADDNKIFYYWAKVFVCEHYCYACNLFCNNPEISGERRLRAAAIVVEWGEKSVDAIDELEKNTAVIENNDHVGLLSLIKAYVYRNRFLAERILGGDYLKWLRLTMDERISLKKHFDYGSIDTHLSDNLNMEYYLALIEYLSFAEELDIDEDDKEDFLDEIKEYLEHEKLASSRNKYVHKIGCVYKNLTDN